MQGGGRELHQDALIADLEMKLNEYKWFTRTLKPRYDPLFNDPNTPDDELIPIIHDSSSDLQDSLNIEFQTEPDTYWNQLHAADSNFDSLPIREQYAKIIEFYDHVKETLLHQFQNIDENTLSPTNRDIRELYLNELESM